MCKGFLIDWFSCPPSHTNPFQSTIRHKAVVRIAPTLAEEIYRIVFSFTPKQEIALLHQISLNCKFMEAGNCTEYFTESMWDILYGINRLLSISQVGVKEDIDMLLSIVEDAVIFKRQDYANTFKWLGYCLHKLWEPLQRIHSEHCGLIPVTSCGPAPGLESHAPKSDTILLENYF